MVAAPSNFKPHRKASPEVLPAIALPGAPAIKQAIKQAVVPSLMDDIQMAGVDSQSPVDLNAAESDNIEPRLPADPNPKLKKSGNGCPDYAPILSGSHCCYTNSPVFSNGYCCPSNAPVFSNGQCGSGSGGNNNQNNGCPAYAPILSNNHCCYTNN
ncbi:hypothetical protein BC830DRAFT_1221544, partial [Chytriomyces sp. MP71]